MSDQPLPPSQEDLDPELRAELTAERPSGPWQIETRHDLEWALARMGSLERHAAENMRAAEEEIDRIRRRVQALNDRLAKSMRFFESHVEIYATTHRTELLGNGRGKTRQLLNGSIGWRTKPAGVEVVDEVAAVRWSDQHDPGTLLLPPSPLRLSLRAVKDLVLAGTSIPGVRVVPESETLVIKTGGGET